MPSNHAPIPSFNAPAVWAISASAPTKPVTLVPRRIVARTPPTVGSETEPSPGALPSRSAAAASGASGRPMPARPASSSRIRTAEDAATARTSSP